MTDTCYQQKNEKALILRTVPFPTDINLSGDVFGRWILSQVDLAGSIASQRFTQRRIVTVAVKSFVFKQPVFVGDLLSFYANIVKTGRTSVTVAVEVHAQHAHCDGEMLHVTEATLTYVAIDKNRRPVALSSLPEKN